MPHLEDTGADRGNGGSLGSPSRASIKKTTQSRFRENSKKTGGGKSVSTVEFPRSRKEEYKFGSQAQKSGRGDPAGEDCLRRGKNRFETTREKNNGRRDKVKIAKAKGLYPRD